MRIGIDLGGTKIEIRALDEHGEDLLIKRVPTPHQYYEGIVVAIRNLVLDTERQLGRRGSVGVAISGSVSSITGLVKNAPNNSLKDHPFVQDLAAALDRPVRVENDANCFTLSEATDGAAAGMNVVFGVILGTGVGGGICVGGRILTGANRIAGEWGHTPLPPHLPVKKLYVPFSASAAASTVSNAGAVVRAWQHVLPAAQDEHNQYPKLFWKPSAMVLKRSRKWRSSMTGWPDPLVRSSALLTQMSS